MPINYDGRVAVVTGAGHGLGRSHALFLAARGAKVVVNDLGADLSGSGETGSAADAVVKEIVDAGGDAVANYDDVSTPQTAKKIVATAIDAFGTVDIVINNAGILRDKSFLKMPVEDFQKVIDVHLMGSVYVTHAAWPTMLEKGYGRVVMTTSAAGLYGNFGQTNYSTAKAGLIGFMLALKEEGQKQNVLVNTIAPVAFTRMLETVMPDSLREKLRPEVPTAAMGYFASEDCAVSGQVLEAGADEFNVARLVRSKGVKVSREEAVQPETIAERFAEIADLTGAEPYDNALAAIGKAFQLD